MDRMSTFELIHIHFDPSNKLNPSFAVLLLNCYLVLCMLCGLLRSEAKILSCPQFIGNKPVYRMWASHLRSCLLSHHVRPAEPFLSFPTVCSDHSLSFRCSSVPFVNPVSRTLPPIAACYCTKHSLISPPAFSPSLSLLATWGNDSITYDPIHLLMMFGHSKAHLRPIRSAFHSLCSSLSVSTP